MRRNRRCSVLVGDIVCETESENTQNVRVGLRDHAYPVRDGAGTAVCSTRPFGQTVIRLARLHAHVSDTWKPHGRIGRRR